MAVRLDWNIGKGKIHIPICYTKTTMHKIKKKTSGYIKALEVIHLLLHIFDI